MGYKDIKCLGRALISTNELNVVDLLKNLRGDPKKLILFYSDYFKYSDFDGKKIGMSRSVMKLIEEEKYMDLINYYQRSDPRNHTKNKFHRKTKGKLIKSTKRITKFQKNPQSIVKQKLQIFSQMENEMKKLRIEIGNLSLKDPKKHEKEKMLKSLTKQLGAMKKKFSFK